MEEKIGIGLYTKNIVLDGSNRKVVKALFNTIDSLLELHRALGLQLHTEDLLFSLNNTVISRWNLNNKSRREAHRMWAKCCYESIKKQYGETEESGGNHQGI